MKNGRCLNVSKGKDNGSVIIKLPKVCQQPKKVLFVHLLHFELLDTKQRELLPLAKRRIIVQKDNFKPCTARVTEQTLQEFIVHPKAIKKFV